MNREELDHRDGKRLKLIIMDKIIKARERKK